MDKRKRISLFGVSALILGVAILLAGSANASSDVKSARPDRPAPGIMGKVIAISGTTLTVSGKNGFGQDATDVSYTVDASGATVKKMTTSATAGEKPTETTIAVSSIQVGDTVMVQGDVSGANVAARSVMVGDMGKGGPAGNHKGGPGMGPGVQGKVTSIDGNKITITYTIDASGATVKKMTKGTDNKPVENTAALSDIAVGDNIMANGDRQDNSVTAKNIMIGDFAMENHDGPPPQDTPANQ